MNKFIGIVMPYVMVVFIGIMEYVELSQKNVVNAFVLGILMGIWFWCIHKAEGTLMMKLGLVLNIVLFIVAGILGIFNTHLVLLSNLAPTLSLLIGVQCVALCIVINNKPNLSMTYRYSYKNKKRRYF